MKIQLQSKHKILLSIVAALIMTVLIILFIIIPTVQDIQTINRNIISEKENLELKFKKGQYMKKVMEDLKNIEPNVTALRSVYLRKGEELDFITTLEKISEKFNLESDINIIQDQARESSDGLQELGIEIQLDGSYEHTLRYLTELEQLDYYTTIHSLEISSTEKNTGRVKSKLRGKIYIKEINDKKEPTI